MKPGMNLAHLPRLVLSGLIRIYRYAISPYLGRVCRFEPSCSAYGLEAVETHGALLGSVLTVKRVCKCHPWHAGGFDPVPAAAPAPAPVAASRPTPHSPTPEVFTSLGK